jgi:hypothetical protein
LTANTLRTSAIVVNSATEPKVRNNTTVRTIIIAKGRTQNGDRAAEIVNGATVNPSIILKQAIFNMQPTEVHRDCPTTLLIGTGSAIVVAKDAVVYKDLGIETGGTDCSPFDTPPINECEIADGKLRIVEPDNSGSPTTAQRHSPPLLGTTAVNFSIPTHFQLIGERDSHRLRATVKGDTTTTSNGGA